MSTERGKGALRLLFSAFKTVLTGLARGFGLAFILLVLVGAGAALWIHSRFGPEDARRLVVDQLQSVLHREVAIDRLVLTPRGLKVRGLHVRRTRGLDGDFLVCDTALLTVKLAPLLKRRLEFDTLRLESPQIALTREADGSWDIADMFTSSAARPSRGGALPVALAAAETIVEDGVLRLDDKKRGRKISFERLSLRAERFDQDAPFPLSVSFDNAVTVGTRTVSTRVSAEGVVDLAGLRWSSATARADRFSGEADGVALSGKGSVTGFVHPVFELEASVPALGPDRWTRWTGRELRLSLPASKVSVRGTWSAPNLLAIERASVSTPAGVAVASATFDLSGDTLTLRAQVSARDVLLEKTADWHPAWAARGAKGKATLRVYAEGPLKALQVKEGELSLRGFGASWGTRRVDGADADFFVADEFGRVKAAASKAKVTAYGNSFEDVAFTLSVVKQTLTVESLAARWGGSSLKLRGKVDHLSAPKEVLISGNLDKLVWEDAQRLVTEIHASISTRTITDEERDSRPWLRTFKYSIPRTFPDTLAHIRVGEVRQKDFFCQNLDLLWTIRGVTPALDKVDGEARLRFGPGRVADIPALQDSHKLLRVIFLPFIYMHKMNKFAQFSTATAYPKTLDFNRIESEYAMSKGVARIRYFHVDSSQLIAFADGDLDFGREQVDMSILTRLPYYNGPSLPEWWIDEGGSVAIGFRVKGDLNKPDLEPRFKKIGADEIEKKLRDGRENGKKRFEAIEKLKDL